MLIVGPVEGCFSVAMAADKTSAISWICWTEDFSCNMTKAWPQGAQTPQSGNKVGVVLFGRGSAVKRGVARCLSAKEYSLDGVSLY